LKVYKGIDGSAIDIKISPEMKKVFDRLLTRSERLKGNGLKEAALDKSDISEHQREIEAAMKPDHLAIHKSAKEKSDRGEPLTETEQLFRDSVDQQLSGEGDVLRQESPLTPEEKAKREENDAAYAKAVEKGDTETAQRMVDEAGGWAGMPAADLKVTKDYKSLWKEYETRHYGGRDSSDYMDVFETKNGGFALSISKSYPSVQWSRSTARGRGRTAYLELLYSAKMIWKKGV
jgi:hypothetical protein